MEDGTLSQGLMLLAWPLAILGVIVGLILLIFERTRKFAFRLFAIAVFALCATHLAGGLSSQARTNHRASTQQELRQDFVYLDLLLTNYQAEHGQLPETEQDILRVIRVAKSPRPATPMLDPWGTHYRYETGADGYRLTSAGPDAVFDTDDDIQH